MREAVRFQLGNCKDWRPRHRPTCVVVNPPWGSRLLADEAMIGAEDTRSVEQGLSTAEEPGVGPELQQAWHDLRDFLKVHWVSMPGS